jgi:hypothetical protein
MGWLRRVVGVGAWVLCASVLGCQSSPSGGARSAPSPTAARAVPAPVATAAARSKSNPNVWAVSPTDTPAPVRTAIAVPSAPPPAIAPTAAPIAPPTDATNAGAPAAAPPPAFAGIPTAQPPPPRPARAFRTPERAGEQAFVAPQGGTAATESEAQAGATGMGSNTGPHGTSAVVAFRVSASEAIAGFALRATYAQSFGHFVALGGGNGADCTGAAGAIITANDTGRGELILTAATAQTLQLPFDVFCRFTVTASERLDAGAFQTTVAEVTLAAGTRGDPGIAAVSISVR